MVLETQLLCKAKLSCSKSNKIISTITKKMSNTLQFTINLDGNAYTGIAQLDKALGKFNGF